MEFIFSIITYLIFGFFGLIGLLFLLAIIFGKRVDKKWEYEAKFRDDKKKEIGEFDIELKRYEGEEDYKLDAKFKLKHTALEIGKVVQVYLNEELVMQGNVTKKGKIYLREDSLVTQIDNPAAGQTCVVNYDGNEILCEALYKD